MDTFADYLPYTDADVPSAMRSVIESPYFPQVAAYVYPGMPLRQVKEKLLAIDTVDALQVVVMCDVVKRVMSNSMTEFTYEVSPHLDPAQRYLFVSNHRDIVLDAMLVDYALHFSGHTTPQIAFGSNLLDFPLMAEVGRANKMFRVDRGGSPREFYNKLMRTSQYIRHTLLEQHESVWIAQRNGRTKDGRDCTDPAIIKMFALSGDRDLAAALVPLRLVPVTVSYEWESCDLLKAEECFKKKTVARYVKAPGEDSNSIMTGVLSPKGRVHLVVGDPLTAGDIEACHGDSRRVAALLDSRINPAFRLYPNNHIAAALLAGTDPAQCATPGEVQAFCSRLSRLSNPDDPVLRECFLRIYANPVNNR